MTNKQKSNEEKLWDSIFRQHLPNENEHLTKHVCVTMRTDVTMFRQWL